MTQRIDYLDHPDPDTLSAFIDDELPAGEQQEAQQHLNGCHSCVLQVLSATQLLKRSRALPRRCIRSHR
jgi:anti-sigma factor RsiW